MQILADTASLRCLLIDIVKPPVTGVGRGVEGTGIPEL